MSGKILERLVSWLRDLRRRIRRLDVFTCVSVVVVLAFFGYFLLANLSDFRSQAQILFAFASVLLTIGLVYSNLVQRPASRFLSISVGPVDRNDLEEGYKATLYESQLVTAPPFPPELIEYRLIQPHAKVVKFFPRVVQEIRCKTTPRQLRVAIDITNIGHFMTSIHEYEVEESPGSRQTYVARLDLPHQKRETLSHDFPKEGGLSQGFYKIRLTAIAATQELLETVWLWISKDKKTIRWCSKKNPLEKCAHMSIVSPPVR